MIHKKFRGVCKRIYCRKALHYPYLVGQRRALHKPHDQTAKSSACVHACCLVFRTPFKVCPNPSLESTDPCRGSPHLGQHIKNPGGLSYRFLFALPHFHSGSGGHIIDREHAACANSGFQIPGRRENLASSSVDLGNSSNGYPLLKFSSVLTLHFWHSRVLEEMAELSGEAAQRDLADLERFMTNRFISSSGFKHVNASSK